MINTLNKEQKSGILLLLASKTFERLAFYSIMSVLIMYLIESLKLETAQAGIYYSIFYSIIILTSLFSGLIGDLRNRVKFTTKGFIIIIAMYFIIAFLPSINYVIITSFVIMGVGIGIITPNTTVLLGNIYNEKENEIIGLPGFVLFSIVPNIAAIIAPKFSVFFRDNYGYSSMFLFASLLAFLSLLMFLKFKKQYNKLSLFAEQKTNQENNKTKKINTLILVSIIIIGLLIRFALNQRELTFTIAAKDYLKNDFSAIESLGNLYEFFSIILMFIFALIISRLNKLNWVRIFNFILIGLAFSIIAFVPIASFSSLSQMINGKHIFIQSYILLILADTIISPVLTYSIYRSSPKKYKGLFQGIFYTIFAILNTLLFASSLLYEKYSINIFIGFTILLIIAAILVVILKKIVTILSRNRSL